MGERKEGKKEERVLVFLLLSYSAQPYSLKRERFNLVCRFHLWLPGSKVAASWFKVAKKQSGGATPDGLKAGEGYTGEKGCSFRWFGSTFNMIPTKIWRR